jgi:histone deacetylase complex regulatory component SIN3
VQELFKGHKTLLLEFNKLIPANFRINVETRPHYQEAIEYMRRVKEETKNTPDVYSEFITVLKKYQDKIMTIEEVNSKVRVIMCGYPTLIENFKAFLPNYNEESSSEDQEETEIQVKPNKKRSSPAHLQLDKLLVDVILDPVIKTEAIFFKRLKKVMDLNSVTNSDYFLELSKSFELYADSIITKKELGGMIEPLFKLTNFSNFILQSSHQTRRFPKDENNEISGFIQTRLTEMFETFKSIAESRESTRRKHGWFFRPLSDFDTVKSKKHGHSYLEIQRPRVLKDKPSPEINEQWVSVPYGSEDVSFRMFRKNMFEDALFKCEDERHDLDLAIENGSYTLRLFERALEDANSLSPESQKNFKLNEKLLTSIRTKPIRSIYSEHAEKIIEMLKTNPIRSLPVVISRIKSKVDTWKKSAKVDHERVWRDVFEKNFYKSLDHRSFYFKQHEKKMMNPRSFLQEAKLRYLAREDSKNLLRKYLKREITQQTFEFLGGSRNTLFFNSFAGLSAGVVHKVSEDYVDEMLQEFQELDVNCQMVPYVNAPDYSVLPHFRMLFSCPEIVYDAMRLVIFALDKSNLIDKSKIDGWVQVFFQDFLGFIVPQDVSKHKVEEYFDGIFRSELEEKPEPSQLEKTLKSVQRWLKIDPNEDLLDENQSPMLMKKEADFKAFLPLLKSHKVMYSTQNLYYFLRFFYDIYERLIKFKFLLSQEGREYEYKKIEYGNYEFSQNTEDNYQGFLRILCLLLKNGIEPAKFEDKCRALIGNDSYVFFTFDKLINYAAKALHSLSTDDLSNKSLPLIQKFLKPRINEEMYLADFFTLSPTMQVFRLHWNERFGVLSATYIESPYDKISEQAIKNSQKYRKHFLTSHGGVALEEFKDFKYRIENYLRSNEVSLNDYCRDVFQFNKVSHGMIENSYRFFYVPAGEDYLINPRYYSNFLILENDSESFVCQDKNSFYQKISEMSEKKFKAVRDSWIMSNN